MIVRSRLGVMLAALMCGTLAGCLGGGGPAQAPMGTATDVATADLGPGFYLFHHAGGALTLRLASGEAATLTLYDGDDHRVGRVDFVRDGFADRVQLEAAPAGDYVVWVDLVNGTLAIDSDGRAVPTVTALGWHVERHILAEAPLADDPLRGLIPLTPRGDPIHRSTSSTFLRPPTALRLLAAGEAENLVVRVAGDRGLMLATTGAYYTTRAPDRVGLEPVEAAFEPSRAAAAFVAEVDASAFSGVLLLEAYSYSRLVRSQVAATVLETAPPFVYGELPDTPVAAQVPRDATHVTFWAPPCSADCADSFADDVAAQVSVFGPDDTAVGVYRLLPNQTLAVPVARGGDYVFIARGGVVLGADAVPADFSLRVLEVGETMLLTSGIGAWDDYEQEALGQDLPGVPFAVMPDRTPTQSSQILDPFDPLTTLLGPPCSLAAATRLVADGETLGYWSDPSGADWGTGATQVNVLLPAGRRIEFVQDGMGDECGQVTGRVLSYLR